MTSEVRAAAQREIRKYTTNLSLRKPAISSKRTEIAMDSLLSNLSFSGHNLYQLIPLNPADVHSSVETRIYRIENLDKLGMESGYGIGYVVESFHRGSWVPPVYVRVLSDSRQWYSCRPPFIPSCRRKGLTIYCNLKKLMKAGQSLFLGKLGKNATETI